ncbi:carbohydrate kinase family protein [Alkalibacillus aidingensis]|uniref:carbohydrate kinase family protein n=1 Tax=Alkalibacillus aidingensis TaxID=2747607 RepID=UPI001660D260|nr:carbohydrate kinase family protein [Alkalibacillus aidingensis]
MPNTTQSPNVLVIGDAGVDIIVHLPKIQYESSKVTDFKEPTIVGGGTSANTAVALKRLGVNTSFLGTIGDDAHGKYVMDEFQNEGVNIDQVIVDPQVHTFSIFAFIDEFGERYPYVWPKKDLGFQKLDLDQVNVEAIRHASWVHSSGISMMDDTSSRHSIIEIFRIAHHEGIPTSLDLNLRVMDGELDPDYKQAIIEVMNYCDYVLGSGEDEFYYLDPQENWLDSVKTFASNDRTIIARMGDEGSFAIQGSSVIKSAAYPVQVVDTLGAGDTYNAGFIAARLSGENIQDSLSQANAVAAYSVSKEGARSSPTGDELERFLSGE